MEKGEYRALSILLFVIVFSFPAYQLYFTGGLLFYTNGWDEASYLQYDYAKHVAEISKGGRLSQYPVILLHELGFSGGYINLIFDFTTLLIILFFLPRVLSLSGIDPRKSRVITLAVLGLPLLFSNFNPLYDAAQNFVMRSEAIKWVTMPYINDPFWLRTPEPQLSIAVLLVAGYAALRLKNLVLLLPIAAISYPFLLIPVIFIILSLIIRDFLKKNLFISSLSSAILISFSLLAYNAYFIPTLVRGYIIPSFLPLLSFCGLLTFIVYTFSPRHYRQISVLLLLSTWFSVNFQLISGFTIQPNNFEQYWSIFALCAVFFLQALNTKYFKYLSALSIALLVTWSFKNFSINYSYLKGAKLSPEILSAMQADSSKVAIPDIYLSTRLDMLFPKQKLLLFSYTRFYKKLPHLLISDFLCARESLKDDLRFQRIIEEASEHYRNGDKNYIMNTIGRVYHPLEDPELRNKTEACVIKISE